MIERMTLHYRTSDLTGMVFGQLTVLRFAGYKEKSRAAQWLCRCMCGREKIILGSRLTKKESPTISCGCRRPGRTPDLVGHVFDFLTVISRVENIDGMSAWRCQCQCGNYRIIKTKHLLAPYKKSCGCQRGNSHAQSSKKLVKDLTGQIFGRLTVIRFERIARSDETGPRGAKWLCRCECGKEKVVAASSLRKGKARSCGCARHPRGPEHSQFKWTGYEQITGRQWQKVLNGAALRNLPVTITIQDAWEQWVRQSGKCNLTGVELNLHAYGQAPYTASLDRINSNQGYVPGTIQWVHKDVNKMKWNFEQDEFIEWCRLIVKNSEERRYEWTGEM